MEKNLKWFKESPNYLHSKQLLLELFETEYEICDHRVNTSPLASVMFQENEKFMDHYLMDSYLELFLYKKVNKYLGITFDEFIDRPRYEIDKMIGVVEAFMAKESSIATDLTNDLANQAKKGK